MTHPSRFPSVLLAVLLLATLPTGTASANWLNDLFQPAGFEELAVPQDSDDDVPMPALEESTPDPSPNGGSLPADSVLLNPPVPVQEGWMPHYGSGLAPEYLSPEVATEDLAAPYSAASPLWRDGPDTPCCDRPTVHYWNHSLLASTVCQCDCDRTVDLVLSVPNGCCAVDVEVCVPGCCSDAPDYDTDRDWLGRITHTYCWPCGYQVKIVQLHIGSWMVHTYNR